MRANAAGFETDITEECGKPCGFPRGVRCSAVTTHAAYINLYGIGMDAVCQNIVVWRLPGCRVPDSCHPLLRHLVAPLLVCFHAPINRAPCAAISLSQGLLFPLPSLHLNVSPACFYPNHHMPTVSLFVYILSPPLLQSPVCRRWDRKGA